MNKQYNVLENLSRDLLYLQIEPYVYVLTYMCIRLKIDSLQPNYLMIKESVYLVDFFYI